MDSLAQAQCDMTNNADLPEITQTNKVWTDIHAQPLLKCPSDSGCLIEMNELP